MIKKKLLIALIVIGLLFAAVYFFVPRTYVINPVVSSTIKLSAAQRKILHTPEWQSWMPGKQIAENIYAFSNCEFSFQDFTADGIAATINMDGHIIKSNFYFSLQDTSTINLGWNSKLTLSNNPINRIGQYWAARNLQKNLTNWLDSSAIKLSNFVNIYGLQPTLQKVTDQYMISVKQSFASYPGVEEVYALIDEIKAYLAKNGGAPKGAPMLNVYQDKANLYHAMVAIPTTTALPTMGKFLQKEMVLGNIVVAEVKGGMQEIIKGEKELHQYVLDYNKTSPAIPFQSLVTDRRAEKDSSKWITKLYYPVLY
jgi:hypothetical protein